MEATHTPRTNSDTVWFIINARIKWHKGAAGGKDLKVVVFFVFFPIVTWIHVVKGKDRFLPKLNLVWNETFFCIKETFHLSFLLP